MNTKIYEVTAIRATTYEVVANNSDEAIYMVLQNKAVMTDETTLKMTAEVKDEDQDE